MLDIKQALQLKRKGILNLDNCIYTDSIPDEQIKELKNYLIDQGLKVEIIDFNFQSIEAEESPETTAIRYLYEAQKIRDKVMSSLDFFIITNYTHLYRNYTTEFLKKSNKPFLCWYVAYSMNLNPIMFLTSKEEENNYGLVNIFTKGGITEAFEQGLKEIEDIVKEAILQKEE